MPLSPREVVIQNIEHRCRERIGYSFTNGRRNDFTAIGVHHGFQRRVWVEDQVEYSTDIWGNVWHRLLGLSQGGEVHRPVLATWKDLDRLQLPDLANPDYYEGARSLAASGTDLFKLGWIPGWPFAICRYMRKMETYFMDLIEHRDHIDVLHDRITSLLENVIDRYGEAGMDGVMFCEDLGVQDRLLMSPTMWRDIFRPLYERLTHQAHKHGMKVIQHSCGYNWLLIDDLCDAGIDCLQFDQPALYDIPALAAKLRHHGVGLFAPCDIQKVLPTGNREIIEQATRELVANFRGGLIAKNYTDLPGIGVQPEWDQWAYEVFAQEGSTL